jgi:hypothetical protein
MKRLLPLLLLTAACGGQLAFGQAPSPDCTQAVLAGKATVAAGALANVNVTVPVGCAAPIAVTWSGGPATVCKVSQMSPSSLSAQVVGVGPGSCQVFATIGGLATQPFTVTVPDDDPFSIDVMPQAILGADSLSNPPTATSGTASKTTFGAEISVWSPIAKNAWYGAIDIQLTQAPGATLDLTNVNTFAPQFGVSGSIEKRLGEMGDLHSFAYCEGGFLNSIAGGPVLQNFITYYDCGVDFRKDSGGPNEANGRLGYGRNPVNNDAFEWGQIFLKGHIHFGPKGGVVFGLQAGLNVKAPPASPDGILRRGTALLLVGVNAPSLFGAPAAGQ